MTTLLFLAALLPSQQDRKQLLFTQRVKPILQRCVVCHGGEEPAGMLDLTTRAGAIKGGESGTALKPGNAKDSLLHGMTSSKAMPPKKPLTMEEVADLRRWIDDGAIWDAVIERKKPVVQETPRAGPDWWSLQPVKRPSLPPIIHQQSSINNPIDLFIVSRLQTAGLTPSPEADRQTLVRRLTFDLTGLPPTPDEVERARNDAHPDWYERLVERLLASSAYGERWARHWLDVARYGESQGFERDKLREHGWRYRDYVIRSFNDDKPYNRFVKEQIAGDVLDPTSPDGIIATGFLVCGPWDEVGATQQGALMRKRAREEELEDMISAVSQTFLGLTVNCARCHNHKFDPIAQRDYYRLKAALEGVHHGDRPVVFTGQERERAEIARLEKELAAIEEAARKRLKKDDKGSDTVLSRPMARWTFEGDARDRIGGLHGTLMGSAKIEGGRLKLDGKTGYVRTAGLTRAMKAKTLEAWVSPADLGQRGGGVIGVQSADGKAFDAIVLGEKSPGKWIAGSDFFRRTRDVNGVVESVKATELVHLAVVYGEEGRISLYRNGRPYGDGYTAAPAQAFEAGTSEVLFGLRHKGAGNGFFAGEIEEARLYDRALTSEEVGNSFKAGIDRVSPEQLMAVLTVEEKRRYVELGEALSRKRPTTPTNGMTYAASIRTPEPTFVLLRGDIEKQGERVSAAGVASIKTPVPDWGLAVDAPEADRRRKLAEWIAHDDNPLTARVMVNRLWHYHFGRGLIATPNDFGYNGGKPTHPELLDWLASEFIRSGWSMKHMHRLIVTSAAYRQSSRFDAKAAAVDADNSLLWRFPSRRLEGEAVRDAMLAVNGQLNRTMHGPSFRPFILRVFNSNFYDLIDPPSSEYQRRTVYRMNVGSAKSPMLESFDCPDPSVKTPQRGSTTTPLQALGLMNGTFVMRQAQLLSDRVKEVEKEQTKQVETAYRMVLCRVPTAEEQDRAKKLVGEHGLESLCWVLLNTSEFLYLR